MENRIKEEQLDLFVGSPHSPLRRVGPHQCGDRALQPARAFSFAAITYVLLSALRRRAPGPTCLARAICGTIRAKLLKIGALVTVSARRARVAMGLACPYAAVFRLADRSAEALTKVGADVLENMQGDAYVAYMRNFERHIRFLALAGTLLNRSFPRAG
jgi:hypothetical protein